MKKISVLLATNSDKAYQYLVPAEFNIKKGQAVNKGDVLVEISI